MGAKTWMLVSSTGNVPKALAKLPAADRGAAIAYAQSLFPNETFSQLEDGDLYYTNPPEDQLFVGSYADVQIVAAREFGIDYPSRLPKKFIPKTGIATLHAMHSVVDWFGFAHWRDGELLRSLSLSPDSGVMEDIGEKLAFEKPYWDGEFPAVDDEEEDDYPFPFHPLELGEAALQNFFGYQIEGYANQNLINPEDFPLVQLKRTENANDKPWWRVW